LKDGTDYSNRSFFTLLFDNLERIDLQLGVSEKDIIELLGYTKTRDKKYDKDGERPFFNHWRRVRPTLESLNKIQRNFGWSIRQECFKNGVTAVFSETISNKSLEFLNPEKQKEAIIKMSLTKKSP